MAPDKVRVRLVWRGGLTTTAELRVPVGKFAQLSDAKEIMATILRLTGSGHSDEQIAAVLKTNGHRSPHGGDFSADAVGRLRRIHGILRFPKRARLPRKPGYLTITQVAEKLKVTKRKIHRHILHGTIAVEKEASMRCYLFPDNLDTITQLRQLFEGKVGHVAFNQGHQDA